MARHLTAIIVVFYIFSPPLLFQYWWFLMSLFPLLNLQRKDGVAPELDRVIPVDRQKFLQNFVEAQMVVWEDVPSEGNGVSKGWFYWNFKME
mmetsp:Transcript_39820/g.93328  ORF Transcript_39820/g.93328 Transcript_39820/m.93328 type:complete len:92 (+) Transcript_39820:1425-1700(+)